MSLTGVHITFGYSQTDISGHAVLPYNATSAQTMASAQTSSASAPPAIGNGQKPLLSISASFAIWYVTGPAPDINNGPRRYFDGTVLPYKEIFVDPGDKIAWTTA